MERGYLIAQTISNVIERNIAGKAKQSKLFFKVRGLPPNIYQELLKCLPQGSNNFSIMAKSTGKISGFPDVLLSSEETSTSLRNSVGEGQALVLLLTRESSEWQSLKNIFTIDESFLLEKEQISKMLDVLTPGKVGFNRADRKQLLQFLEELSRFMVPQLIPVTDFLCRVKKDYEGNTNTGLKKVIGQNLPQLGLFADPILFEYKAWPKRLKENFHASTLTTPKGAMDLNKVRDNLEKYLSTDNANETVAKEINEYLNGVSNEVLKREWEVVKRIFNLKAPRKGLADRIKEWANKNGITLSQADHHLLERIQNKKFDEEQIRDFLDRYEQQLTANIKKKLRKLIETDDDESTYADFVMGLYIETLNLLGLAYFPEETEVQMKVSFTPEENEDNYISEDRVELFHKLYRGLEKLLYPRVELDVSNLAANESRETKVFKGLLFTLQLWVPDSEGNGDHDGKFVRFRWNPDLNLLLEDITPAISAVNNNVSDDGPLYWPVFDLKNQSGSDKLSSITEGANVNKKWYLGVRDLGKGFIEEIVESNELCNSPQVKDCLNTIVSFSKVLRELFSNLEKHSLLEIDLNEVERSYINVLNTFLDKCQTVKQILILGNFINNLLVVWISEEKVLVPLIHPLKLLWWQKRSESICGDLTDLISNPSKFNFIKDESKYRKYYQAKYSSLGLPSMLATHSDTPTFWVSIDEAMGFELFNSFESSVLHWSGGKDSASGYIFRILRDYVEVYPSSRDGLDVFVPYCPDVSIITNALEKASSQGLLEKLRKINLAFHHDEHAIQLFHAVNNWINKREEYAQRDGKLLFPKIELNVFEGDIRDRSNVLNDYDIAILIDYFNKQNLVELEVEVEPAIDEEYWFTSRSYKTPYTKGNAIRKVNINSRYQPHFIRLFHNLQVRLWKPDAQNKFCANEAGIIKKKINLHSGGSFLDNLHKNFNWVACYDPNVDKYLMKSATKFANVIRYHSGLGIRGDKNLTVSSSGQLGWGLLKNTMLTKKLYKKVVNLLKFSEEYEEDNFAKPLVEKANKVSGSLVLKAIGPGKFLQEMLGTVLATDTLEQHCFDPGFRGLAVWLSLDDFEGRWFNNGTKRPDIALIKADLKENGDLTLEIHVAEVKFTGQQSLDTEVEDAKKQVVRGLSFFNRVLNTEYERLDKEMWYREISDVLIDNLYYDEYDEHQEAIVNQLNVLKQTSKVDVMVSGHIFGFCYDSDAPEVVESSNDNCSCSDVYEDDIRIKKWLYNKQYVQQRLIDMYKNEGSNGMVDFGANESEERSESKIDDFLALLGENSSEQENNEARDNFQDKSLVNHFKEDHNKQMVEKEQKASKEEKKEKDYDTDEDTTYEENSTEDNPPEKSEELPTDIAGHLQEINKMLSDYDDLSANQQVTEEAEEKLEQLFSFLRQHSISIRPAGKEVGPNVIRIKLKPSGSTRVSNVARLQDDIKVHLSLEHNPFIFAGPGYIGVDVERKSPATIGLKQVLEQVVSRANIMSGLKFPLGLDISGEVVIADFADSNTPHLLVAGQTGAGKSVFLSSIIFSLMSLNTPDKVQFVMIDPKQVELTPFEGSPYLYQPIITDVEEALKVLNDLIEQMDNRYTIFRQTDRFINNIEEYRSFTNRNDMPRIVVVFDEFADFMEDKAHREEMESALKRLSAKARAAGIHLLICTQTPKAEVVTTNIRNNLTARVGLRVPDKHASGVIGVDGAESLLGKGDLLFKSGNEANPIRGKSPFVSREEMRRLLTWFEENFE